MASAPTLHDFLPISILTDSYKTTHFLQYPPGVTKMVAVSSTGFAACKFRCGCLRAPTTPCLVHPPASPASRLQYGEFRTGFKKDFEDTRMVWYGIRYIIEQYVCRKWTAQDVERADAFYSRHMAPTHTAYPYPKDLFLKFIEENDGYMPVRIESLPEGTAIHAHVPVFQVGTCCMAVLTLECTKLPLQCNPEAA